MDIFITIFIIILLFVIVIQDFRQREISWFLIPLLLLVFVSKGLILLNKFVLLRYSAINFGFIFFQLLMLTVYMSIKNKKPMFILNTYLGIGDVLFLIVLCSAFSPANFIVFYLSSLIFTLIIFSIYKLIVKNADKHIPLAGVVAALMIGMVLLKSVLPQINFYDDDFIISLLIIK